MKLKKKKGIKENYLPWQVQIEDFFLKQTTVEKLKFLLNFAVLAPSSHNSQPWSFSISDNVIKVSKNLNRTLPVGDENFRQLYISLGCAIQNILIAADYYGYSTNLVIKENGDSFIELIESSKISDNNNHLLLSVSKRMVNRGEYLREEIDREILDEITNFAFEDLQVKIISKDDVMHKLADVALRATSCSMSNEEFRKELSKYILPNTSKKKIGMPGSGLGFPTPLSYFAPFMLKKFNMSKLSNKKDSVLLKKFTPYMTIISSKGDDVKSWIKTGILSQKIFLSLTHHGISTAVWAAPIQISEYYKDIQFILKSDLRPQIFFRMGYAKKTLGGHSPRLNVEETIV